VIAPWITRGSSFGILADVANNYELGQAVGGLDSRSHRRSAPQFCSGLSLDQTELEAGPPHAHQKSAKSYAQNQGNYSPIATQKCRRTFCQRHYYLGHGCLRAGSTELDRCCEIQHASQKHSRDDHHSWGAIRMDSLLVPIVRRFTSSTQDQTVSLSSTPPATL
jgi:hypothetical protein